MRSTSSESSSLPWRRVAHALGLLVLIAVVLLFVVASVPQLAGADESYVVLSDSMSPAIEAGAVVFVNEVPTGQIEQGDVITFQSAGVEDGAPTTHRVVEIQQQGGERQFVTQGDANEDPDPRPVSPAAVVGTVSFHIPLIGYVISFAGTDLGLLALVVVPAALLILLEARDLWQSAEDDSPNSEGKL